MTKIFSWHPLLRGDEAERAWQAILEVAEALRSPPGAEEGAGESPPEVSAEGACLAHGSAGMALFYSYLSQARADAGYADVALAYVDHMSEAAAQVPMVPSLYMGFPGVAWVIEHLAGRLFEPEEGEEDSHREIDEGLIRALRQHTWTRDYDLISGLAGWGVYALERLPRPSARECLELLVLQLEALAVEQSAGITWHTKPELLPESQRQLFPNGYYNVGMAHGTPAVIAILAEIRAAGIAAERSRPLLDGAVRWLLAQELEPGARSRFPNSVGEGVESQPARLAWCYGDPGVAAALLLAARRVGRADWEREALRIARAAARRSPELSQVRDAGLCHGAAGLGHVYNRFYQATGDEEMAATARFWYRMALELRRPGEGVAGYLTWTPEPDGNADWLVERGLLVGAAGVAMGLLGAVTAIEPQWDQVLLTAIPPHS